MGGKRHRFWFTLGAGWLALLGLSAQPALAAPKVDQQCVPGRSGSGGIFLSGAQLSQSFKPDSPTAGGADVQLVSLRRDQVVELRMRLVGRRFAAETNMGRFSTQVFVLAQQRVQVTLRANRPTWAKMQLSKPIAWADAIGMDEYAIEAALPEGRDVAWTGCTGYAKGYSAAGTDPGFVADRETPLSFTEKQRRNLAFVVYSSTG